MYEKEEYAQLVGQAGNLLAPSFTEDWPLLPVTKAEGIYLESIDGRRIMDFTAGIAVTNVGHNHPRVMAAARDEMEQLCHCALGLTLHEPVLKLTRALQEVMPEGMEMFFFGNSGAEAVEGAIKLARFTTKKPVIIAFQGGFHGRTYGAASVTSIKSKYRLHYEPFVPGVYFAEYAYPYRCPVGQDPEKVIQWSLDSLQTIFDRYAQPSEVAALLVEPIQGEGGYIVPPDGWLKALRRICDDHGILLIFDEVQTGFGRTGSMFASQYFNVRPDIMAIAKGIANGFPLSATVSSRELMSRWSGGSHGTTFGGNPVACAAALATLEILREENLLENAREMGALFLDGLRTLQEKFEGIGETRGIGLMVALEMIVPGGGKIPNPRAAMDVLEGCLERGLLGYMAGLHGHVIRFMPPLIVTQEQIQEALEIIEASLEEL